MFSIDSRARTLVELRPAKSWLSRRYHFTYSQLPQLRLAGGQGCGRASAYSALALAIVRLFPQAEADGQIYKKENLH